MLSVTHCGLSTACREAADRHHSRLSNRKFGNKNTTHQLARWLHHEAHINQVKRPESQRIPNDARDMEFPPRSRFSAAPFIATCAKQISEYCSGFSKIELL
jgi:hypothetical protein